MALSPGSNVGPYRIIEPVGRGGMASVFKAYEPSLDRYIALKVLPPEFLHDPTFAERFRREAQTVARLEHPQIIPIFAYDIDMASGTPWMAMRLVSGGSLSQRIKRGRLAPSECARILKDVGDALDYAHSAGVIHRDVKPQNVLLDDAGRVYLADFGIAKMVESSAHMTQTGMITGTPQYMAPEQALGKPIDKSIDIYALGIVAYELFTGNVPFSADTPVAVLMKQASEPMPLPPVSEVKEEVTRAILRATAKDPAGRWPSASSFAQAITIATTDVGSTHATSAMFALSEATSQGVSAPAAPTVLAKTQVARPGKQVPERPPVPARTKGGGGAGIAVAIVALLGLALMAAGATYLAYKYYQSTQVADVLPTSATPPPEAIEQPTPEVGPTSQIAAPTPDTVPNSGAGAEVPTESAPPSSPTARRPLLGRGSEARRERIEAILEPKRENVVPVPENRVAVATEPSPVPAPRVARTRINLEVEASQPSTGSQISALYGEILIDNRTVRSFVIRFSGANSFVRWKKVETVTLEGVPLSAREITVAIATDERLNEQRMEGSTRLSLEGEETNLSVAVRFYNQFDKSVKFR